MLVVAGAQALALLALASLATTAGWRARIRALLSLCGPLALVILAVNAMPDWRSLGAALAVALDRSVAHQDREPGGNRRVQWRHRLP